MVMEKQARLITVTLTTRVVLNTPASDEEIAAALKKNLSAIIENNEASENISMDVMDTSVPYDGEEEATIQGFNPAPYYQPILDHPNVTRSTFKENWVFREKYNAEQTFPGVEIKEYTGDDIKDAKFLDVDFTSEN